MSHSFEKSRPDHEVHELGIPQGHAHLDQKYQKGMRAPIASRLPMENGEANKEVAPGLPGENSGQSGY